MEPKTTYPRIIRPFLLLLAPLALSGCGLFSWSKPEEELRAPPPPSVTPYEIAKAAKKQLTPEEAQEELSLNDGFTLLYELMVKESDVDKILILRNASPPTQNVIHQIASMCATARDHLDAFAKVHPLLRLDHHDLPKAEVDTREAIKWATTKKLLLGVECELKLVLTQVSATEYAAFLAQTLADQDKDEQRKAWLVEMAKIFQSLHQKVVQRLAVKP